MSWAERAALGVIICCFGFGVVTHALDYGRFGWLPYRFGPPALNAFWNALVVLDAIVVALLTLGRRRAGLAFGIALMVTDVSVNSYAWQALGLESFATAVAVQACFLGFLIGSALFLWGHDTTAHRGRAHRRARS